MSRSLTTFLERVVLVYERFTKGKGKGLLDPVRRDQYS